MKETITKVKARKKVLESVSVDIYKRLLNIFGDFIDRYPATAVDGLFELLVEQGIKILPKDKRGLAILEYMVCEYTSTSMCVQKILNTRFRNLPANLKPITKSGRRHEIAFWCKDSQISDQIKSLLNFDGKGNGYWADAEGKKVTLLDTVEKKC